MKVPVPADFYWFDETYFYTCGTKVVKELCMTEEGADGSLECFESSSPEAAFNSADLSLYLSLTSGSEEYVEQLKVFKPKQ